MGELTWLGIADGAWLLLENGIDPDGGVIRAYVLGIESDDWLWKCPGCAAHAPSLGMAMAQAQTAIERLLAPPPADGDGDDRTDSSPDGPAAGS